MILFNVSSNGFRLSNLFVNISISASLLDMFVQLWEWHAYFGGMSLMKACF